jgi:c-di-GMP-binding flagellar brake protein YcgR
MTHSVEDSEYAIRNRREIVFVLEDLVKHRAILNLHTPNGLNVLTSILLVDAESGYLYMDVSQDKAINEQVVSGARATFATQLGVRVRWQSEGIELVEMEDGVAFALEIPEVIERIQRREYFRLKVSQSNGLVCKMPDGDGICQAPVADMSVGGVGISVRGTVPAILSQGAVLEGCSIEFPSVGVVPLNLRVCGIWVSSTTRSGEHMYHVGLEFVNLSRGASNVVQRYMIQLESERLSLS